MCGRYELLVEPRDLASHYSLEAGDLANFETSEEIFPSQWSLTLLPGYQFGQVKWGFKEPWAKRLIINSRLETVDEKKTTRQAFASQRCLLPASAFFEWNADKRRYRISLEDAPVFSLAGIYKFYQTEEGQIYAAYSLLTMDAACGMEDIHQRMPVILPTDLEGLYLDHQVNPAHLKRELKNIRPPFKIEAYD